MAFRAFYALPAQDFTAAGGQHTNAVYGFFLMLTKLLETDKPTHIAVAFDPSRVTFRTEMFPDYKGTRSEAPAEFEGQVELIGAVLEALGVPTLTIENFEADDVLATLATRGARDGYEVLVASGDRDTFQLVTDDVTVLYPGRSASDLKYMTPEEVETRYGVPPAQYPEIAALVGETSDNLPGVPGVGEKTAAQWLQKWGGLENLLENANKISGKRGQALQESIEMVQLNRAINRLVTDMDLPLSPDECTPSSPDAEELDSLFDMLEFTRLRTRLYQSMAPLWEDGADLAALGLESSKTSEDGQTQTPVVAPTEIVVVTPDIDGKQYLTKLQDGAVGLWGQGRLAPTDADLEALAVTGEELTLVFDTADMGEENEKALANFLAQHDQFIVHGGKALQHGVAARGWELNAPRFDTQLAAYLAKPDQRRYDLDLVAQQYLPGIKMGAESSGKDEGAIFDLDFIEGGNREGPSAAQTALAQQAQIVLALKNPLETYLEEHGGLDLLQDVELPGAQVLYQMEATGIAIDVAKLEELRQEFSANAHQAAEEAYAAIGHEVNLGSPKQLQVVLFEELNMPKTRKTKTGWTTDAEALADLYQKTEHPFLEALLRHRDTTKMLQMVEGLLSEVQPDGRIHTTFHQTVAATGRVASSDPNLQNIPVRTDAGIRIRDAFVAGPGYEALMSVDYSQIEMRIMAHLSKDEDLINAFNSGEDLHKTMASQVFGVPVEDVTTELRNRIKATSYGLAYGLSPFGLSKQLGVSVDEARKLHDQYFARFGGIGDYLQTVVSEARQVGYTETMLGRRRYFPELESTVRRVREMAERGALNAPIQGSAADLIKVAMIKVGEQLETAGMRSRMLLQVHDELVLELAPGEEAEVRALVEVAMAGAASLSVPLDVAVGVGHSWREAAH